MKRVIRAIIRGCGYVPGYGRHPGTGYVMAFTLVGMLAGADRDGWLGILIGGSLMLLISGALYLLGAYERGK